MTGWNFACADWEQRLRDGRSLVPDLPLFKDKADRAVRIFDKLCVPDIEGQPPFAIAAGEWFRDIVRVIFGSLDDEGVRHVPEVFALVGKKNSKTTSGAGLMVTALLMNEVPWAEFLFIGPTQEIADLAFQQAAGMVEADPDGYLAKRFHVVDHKKTIRDRRNKAFVKVKTFDMKVMTGSKPIGVLVDELHVMGSIHYAARVVGQIRGALESKKNSFLLIITTQSDEPPAGVFRAELQYARAVRAGRIVESRMLPLLYEFPEAMQTDRSKPWADPTYWPMVMPNLGRSLHLDTMIAGYRAAKEKGEEEERRWASQHLNIEIGLALQSDNWVGADFWVASPADISSLAALKARCEVVVIGIDGGGLDDLLGLTLLGRERGTGAMPGGNWSVLDDQVSYPRPAGGADDCSRILRCPPWRLSVPWRSASGLKRRVSGRRREELLSSSTRLASHTWSCLQASFEHGRPLAGRIGDKVGRMLDDSGRQPFGSWTGLPSFRSRARWCKRAPMSGRILVGHRMKDCRRRFCAPYAILPSKGSCSRSTASAANSPAPSRPPT